MSLLPRIQALEFLVGQYEKSLAEFSAINEELRTLPPSQRLTEILELNEKTLASTARLLETARCRLDRERVLTRSPFDVAEGSSTRAMAETAGT